MHEAKLRVVVIGAGAMANRVHFPALAAFPDVEIAAICDVNQQKLIKAGQRYGVTQLFDDYRLMLERVRPDAVYAIGQPHLFFDIWVHVLQSGFPLYIEKPMGLSMHQAQILAYLADSHQCITQVGFQRRTSPMLVALREACLKRGPILQADCAFFKYDPNPCIRARDHLLDDGIHAIDTLRWLCGGEVVAVDSACRRVGMPDINVLSALLRFDNGAIGYLLGNWLSGRRAFKISMHSRGTYAEAEHEESGVLYVDGAEEGTTLNSRTVAQSNQFHIHAGFQRKSREFLDAVKSGTLPGSHFGDAIKTMKIAEVILAQALLKPY